MIIIIIIECNTRVLAAAAATYASTNVVYSILFTLYYVNYYTTRSVKYTEHELEHMLR